MRRLISMLFAAAVLAAFLGVPLVSSVQAADDYPSRPIRLAVGFAPGGATDVVARLITGQLGQELEIGRAHV